MSASSVYRKNVGRSLPTRYWSTWIYQQLVVDKKALVYWVFCLFCVYIRYFGRRSQKGNIIHSLLQHALCGIYSPGRFALQSCEGDRFRKSLEEGIYDFRPPPSLAFSFPSLFLPWSICPLDRQEDPLFWRWFPWPEGGPAWGLCRPCRKTPPSCRQHVQLLFSSEGAGAKGLQLCVWMCVWFWSVFPGSSQNSQTHTHPCSSGA